jgi:hypothetical protein
MSTSEATQSPRQFEQSELTKLEDLYRQLIFRTQTFANTQTAPSPPFAAPPHVIASYCFQFAANRERELASFLSELQEWQKTFLTYEPGARYLNDAGFPQLAGRLLEILKDIGQAMQSFFQAHLSQGKHLQTITGIWAQAQGETLVLIQQTLANRQRVYNDALKRWSDITFNKCPHCGFFLSSRTYPFCGYCYRKSDELQ